MKVAILGSGPGGYVAAIKAAQLGAHVTVVEESLVGGTCLNWGCIPTKVLATSAELLTKLARVRDYGIELTGTVSLDFTRILERKQRIVTLQAKGILSLFKMRGIVFKRGRGELLSPTEIAVSSADAPRETVRADRIIIATGSRPYELPGLPFDRRRILSTDDVFDLHDPPRSLVIIGAGVSGCEFASIFSQFGSRVTVIEKLPRALPTEDIEISDLFEREMKKRGVRILTGVTVDQALFTDDRVRILLTNGNEVEGEKVLVSAGRTFNSERIGLETVGVRTGSFGEIVVDDRMETTIPSVYAVGDVTGGHLLAHVASAQGIVAAVNCMGGDERVDYTAVPSAIFTTPEIASVGLREQDAAATGRSVRSGHFAFRSLARSHVLGDIEGIVKIIADATTDRILGMHIIGPHASDLIHEGVLALSRGLTARDVARSLHAHPTLAEVIQEAAAAVHGEAIHARGT